MLSSAIAGRTWMHRVCMVCSWEGRADRVETTLALDEGVSSRWHAVTQHRPMQTMLHGLVALCTPRWRSLDDRHICRHFPPTHSEECSSLLQRSFTRPPRQACFPRADPKTSIMNPVPSPNESFEGVCSSGCEFDQQPEAAQILYHTKCF